MSECNQNQSSGSLGSAGAQGSTSGTIRAWIAVCCAYTIVLGALLLPLFLRHVEAVWDAHDLAYPAITYIGDALREGRFPLWDPYTNCGFPAHADTKWTFNPAALILGYLFDSGYSGFIAYWVLYWWLGGMGMIFFARHYGASPLGSMAAAFAYALSGFFIGHAEHMTFVVIGAWLPWTFLLAEKAVLEDSYGYALLAGTSLGLSSLGGYSVLVPFTGFTLAVWLCLRVALARGDRALEGTTIKSRLIRIARMLAITAVVALLIWSPVLNAFFTEGGGYTDRTEPLTPAVANENEIFSGKAFFSLLFPYVTIFGKQWIKEDVSMSNGYVGILSIPLAVFWFWRVGRKRYPWLLAFLVMMILISLGAQGGIRSLLYYVFPPLQYFRFSAPFRVYWILPLALWAGLGLSHLQAESDIKSIRPIFIIWSIIAVAAIVLAHAVFPIPGGKGVDAYFHIFGPAVLLLSLAMGAIMGSTQGDKRPKRAHIVGFLFLLITVDMSVHLYNNSHTVWTRWHSIGVSEMLHARSTMVYGPPAPRLEPMYFGFSNVQQIAKVPVVQGYTPMSARGFDVLCKSRFVEVLQSPMRFWLSPGAEPVRDRAATLSDLSMIGVDAPVPVALDKVPEDISEARSIPGTFGSVLILTYAPEAIEMEVNVPGPSSAILASSERYAAGWRAWVDDEPARVLKVNIYFRGIIVPPGIHNVVWRYEPARWKELTGLSYTVVILSSVTGIFLVRRMRRLTP